MVAVAEGLLSAVVSTCRGLVGPAAAVRSSAREAPAGDWLVAEAASSAPDRERGEAGDATAATLVADDVVTARCECFVTDGDAMDAAPVAAVEEGDGGMRLLRGEPWLRTTAVAMAGDLQQRQRTEVGNQASAAAT